MKKKIGIFISLFVIVVMLVILIFNLFYRKNDDDNHENDNDTVTIKKLDVNSDLVQELYSLVNPSNDARILKELYGNSNLTDSYILSMGMTNYIREHSQDEDFQLSKMNIEKSIYQILGYSVNVFYPDVDMYNNYACTAHYNNSTEQYELIDGCGGSQFEYFSRKIVEAQEEDEAVRILEKVIYVYNDWDIGYSKQTVYNNCEKEKKLDYIEDFSDESKSISIDDYINEASTYVYTFHKQNNQYIFEGIKRLDN